MWMRRGTASAKYLESKCLFCEKGDEDDNLYAFATFEADTNVRSMVTELQDTQLLSKIAAGDLIAIEAKYHLLCLVKMSLRHWSTLFAIL